jgi:iron(III) transport system ATP-binding protein
MFLTLAGIRKRFGAVTALDGVSLAVDEGEFVCFLGPSGCGKTTLLRIIAGLETPDEATITLDGRDLMRVPARLRNFGIVFQSYSLFPNLTVARNIAYGLACRGWDADATRTRVEAMLDLVNLRDYAERRPHQLSGGQQQRVALARALAPQPRVLLLDEPLSALDAKVREDLRTEIKSLQSKLRVTTVMVTHDQHEAMELADRIVVMNRGAIEQVGPPRELYDRPANRFVADFLGRMNAWPDRDGRPVLGVRPEHVELVAGADAADGANGVIRGTIERVVFLGSVTRVVVRAGERPCIVELKGSRLDLAAGQPVALRAPGEALLRLEKPAA